MAPVEEKVCIVKHTEEVNGKSCGWTENDKIIWIFNDASVSWWCADEKCSQTSASSESTSCCKNTYPHKIVDKWMTLHNLRTQLNRASFLSLSPLFHSFIFLQPNKGLSTKCSANDKTKFQSRQLGSLQTNSPIRIVFFLVSVQIKLQQQT